MKANEAPEKIYVDSKAIGDDISTTVHTKRQNYSTCTEYIHTNAFIKKATLWLTTNANDYCILHNSYDTEGLVKDFVDAMKRD